MAVVAALIAGPSPWRAIAAAEPSGEQIYAKQCAQCHGKAGEGNTEDYAEPLVGELSVGELARLIDKTMPFEHPEKLDAAGSLRVATYIHDAFYSPLAQERNRPARIELSRLTVRQYQNAVSDLIGSFRPSAAADSRQGLSAEYYKGRRFRSDSQVETRIDPQIDFDFGTASPVPGKTEDYEYSIRWEGSVFAPDTGDYEFIVRTEHAVRFWINDLDRPLIDAWVKSGSDAEFRGSIHLLGGRRYPLRLEFSKAKQGVDDSAKQKKKPESQPATIRLAWKRPHAVEEPVPARCLSPGKTPARFVLTTPFPPDDRSVGYERGNAISRAWDNATTDAALEVASYIAGCRVELAGIREAPKYDPGSPSGRGSRRRGSGENLSIDTAEERRAKLRAFSCQLIERAFRQPLDRDETAIFVDQQFAESLDEETALKRVVILALKSPRFLYRELDPRGASAYAVASRLSFALWDSLPDAELLSAAAEGRLQSRGDVAREAERMLADERAHAKLREFLLQWLKVDQMHDLAKDSKHFPEFTPEVIGDLRTSLDLFLDDVVWSERSDFRELLEADWLFLNGRLAKLYRADLPADAPFVKMALPPGQRAGILTHPFLMAGFAYTASSSPIHRGVFIARSLLGRSLRPPPVAVSPLPVELHADLTTRQRIELQTKGEACQSCHAMINPLGFSLENLDAIGRFRRDDAGQPVNATGGYRTRKGDFVEFAAVPDLARFLANSDEVHTAFAEQLFQYLIKQPIRAYGSETLLNLRNSFAASGFNIRALAAQIATTAALGPVPMVPETASR